jgi:hypothetical protein
VQTVPVELVEEICSQLKAGLNPQEVADVLGRKARLDFGEIASIRSAAIRIQQTIAN